MIGTTDTERQVHSCLVTAFAYHSLRSISVFSRYTRISWVVGSPGSSHLNITSPLFSIMCQSIHYFENLFCCVKIKTSNSQISEMQYKLYNYKHGRKNVFLSKNNLLLITYRIKKYRYSTFSWEFVASVFFGYVLQALTKYMSDKERLRIYQDICIISCSASLQIPPIACSPVLWIRILLYSSIQNQILP